MITYEETIELLQRAVTEKGDGHTSDARYAAFSNGYHLVNKPNCLVGYVLSYLGINLVTEVMPGEQFHRQRPSIVGRFSPRAITALQAAQDIQDDDGTWGEALIAAKEVAP